ncbi:MAG: hypothetical protein RSA64_06580 [Christensenellaceae bacterium]
MKKIQIAVCADKLIAESVIEGIHLFEEKTKMVVEIDCFSRREELLYGMRKKKYEVVMVALFGALGMETVMGAREEDESAAIIWISDEEAFALQSYRLRVTMFLVNPATSEQISDALNRCTAEICSNKEGER